jgi:ADP-heptose:LPS heptosyltransferase
MAEILILKPSSLGDIVHTLPSVAILRRAFPKANIRWLVNTEWMPLLAGNPHIDETIEFPRRNFRGLRGTFRIAPWIRKLRERLTPDLILDYQGLLRSALIAKFCQDDKARVIGLSDAREGARNFYDETVDVSGVDHAVDRYLALTRHVLGLSPGAAAAEDTGGRVTAPLSWPLPWGERPEGFDPMQRFIVLHPFSRGAGKSLDAAQVVELCRALSAYKIVIVGRSDVKLPEMEGVRNLLNRTNLPQLIWYLRYACYIVSVDSGPMHIAAAIKPRLVSIHTWSDPAKVGPYQPEAWVWKDGALFQMKDLAFPDRWQSAPAIIDVANHVAAQVHP